MNDNGVNKLGNIFGHTGGNFAGNVYDKEGLAPTIQAHVGGGHSQPMIVDTQICAMRGRNPDNPSDRSKGTDLEQRLELNQDETANTLTTVQKDNLVMENTVKIKQATKDGTIDCEIGGCFDGSYPDSKTRRGRIQEGGNITPTFTSQNQDIYRIEDMYRIRKLTPRECGRLMGVSDEDITKMQAVNSNTQCYKQAGNSIVVDVMCAMFRNLNIKGVATWDEVKGE